MVKDISNFDRLIERLNQNTRHTRIMDIILSDNQFLDSLYSCNKYKLKEDLAMIRAMVCDERIKNYKKHNQTHAEFLRDYEDYFAACAASHLELYYNNGELTVPTKYNKSLFNQPRISFCNFIILI